MYTYYKNTQVTCVRECVIKMLQYKFLSGRECNLVNLN